MHVLGKLNTAHRNYQRRICEDLPLKTVLCMRLDLTQSKICDFALFDTLTRRQSKIIVSLLTGCSEEKHSYSVENEKRLTLLDTVIKIES